MSQPKQTLSDIAAVIEADKKQLNDETKQALQHAVDHSFNMLVGEDKSQLLRNKIPESVFKHHFLGFFAGEEKPSKDNRVVTDWIAVAGSTTNEVDVFDDRTHETLFTVPALLDTNMLDTVNRRPNHSLSDIMNMDRQLAGGLISVRQNFLHTSLQDRLGELVVGQSSRSKEQINGILKRYGKERSEQTTTTQTSSETPGSEFE
jgi:hypothetical protein